MRFLVQNAGEAPVEAYTLLGFSTARDSKVSGVIGQFGSGGKHSINVLLRAGLDVRIYAGKTCIRFFTKPEVIGGKEVEKVYAKLSGASNRTLALGWTLEFGGLDWKAVEMALREFVSNAIDQTLQQGATVDESIRHEQLQFAVVADAEMRAKSGHTRVYVEATDEVVKYFNELPKRFLQLSQDPLKNSKIQPKRDRNVTDSQKAVIYREGVYVCELAGKNSICDYNFSRSELDIDESRNLNEYVVRAAIANHYRNAEPFELARVFKAVLAGTDCLEGALDTYYLKDTYAPQSRKDTQRTKWREAWSLAAGDAILCPKDAHVADSVIRKGHTPKIMANDTWREVAAFYGITSSEEILTSNEKAGRVETAPTAAAVHATREVWSWLETAEVTKDKPCPFVMGFNELTEKESECYGYFRHGGDTIWIRNDLGGNMLLETVLEELAHYVTGATDNSRDFQNYFMRIIVRYLAPKTWENQHVAVQSAAGN